MAKTKEMPTTEFNLTVPLLGVILKDGDRIKYLRVEIDHREYWVKIPKTLRPLYDPAQWQTGTILNISGTQTIDRKKGMLCLEADTWQKAESSIETTEIKQQNRPAQILICSKKDCWQNGGKDIYQCLEQEISDRGLGDRVRLQTTGCQKQCKQAPNLVVMPTKKRYQSATFSQTQHILQEALQISTRKAE